jgi:hypothetical protein
VISWLALKTWIISAVCLTLLCLLGSETWIWWERRKKEQQRQEKEKLKEMQTEKRTSLFGDSTVSSQSSAPMGIDTASANAAQAGRLRLSATRSQQLPLTPSTAGAATADLNTPSTYHTIGPLLSSHRASRDEGAGAGGNVGLGIFYSLRSKLTDWWSPGDDARLPQ